MNGISSIHAFTALEYHFFGTDVEKDFVNNLLDIYIHDISNKRDATHEPTRCTRATGRSCTEVGFTHTDNAVGLCVMCQRDYTAPPKWEGASAEECG
jgi:hypothetical protein